jgi:hypothetical protein
MSRRLIPLAVAVLAAAAAVPIVRADADPASDFLISQKVYLPFFGNKPTKGAEAELRKVVDQANASGYKIKVAVIGSPNDLGGVGGVWNRPRAYAPFLGEELRFAYKGPLLVVMPAGFGFYNVGRPVTKEQRALEGVKLDPNGDGLTLSAARGVEALAKANGVNVSGPSDSSGDGNSGRIVIAVAGGLALILILGLPFVLREYRRRRPRSSLS